ncbi:MAG TPA: hypothetical protein VEZ15_13210 [Acidimicrobiia bacterium]|nr:hypothetical protein [Acidimicrobiia bacterium]
MTGSDVLNDSDFMRGSRRAFGEAVPHNEWYHFVVHDDHFRLIVNFSVIDRPDGTAHRVIALVRHDEWIGVVETFDATECEARSGRVGARFGPCRFALVDGTYELTLWLSAIGLRAHLRFAPASIPFVVNNQPLAPGARLSWLFVPRLIAHGDVWVGTTRTTLHGAPAYHDHNWGRFRWGDDFGWEWGSVLPRDPADPWTIVCMRMTDRSRRCATRQALYAWHEHEPVALWRDFAMTMEHEGFLRRAPSLTLPPVMSMLTPGSASDVPARIVIRGRGHDVLEMTFEPAEYVRVVVPDEVDTMGVVLLNEISGRIRARGRVAGRDLDVEATGVFELLH